MRSFCDQAPHGKGPVAVRSSRHAWSSRRWIAARASLFPNLALWTADFMTAIVRSHMRVGIRQGAGPSRHAREQEPDRSVKRLGAYVDLGNHCERPDGAGAPILGTSSSAAKALWP